jgi:hypothetical protein
MNEKETEVFQIVKKHLEMYPLMQPQDVMKLLYQRNYGPEHAIADPHQSLQMLEAEAKDIAVSADAPLFTPIGNAFVRLNLERALHDYTAEQVNDMFIRSAGVIHGSLSQFLADIKLIQRNFDGLKADFTLADYEEYLSWYRSQAYPAVHHSPIYRQNYAPHYRVVFNHIWNALD